MLNIYVAIPKTIRDRLVISPDFMIPASSNEEINVPIEFILKISPIIDSLIPNSCATYVGINELVMFWFRKHKNVE